MVELKPVDEKELEELMEHPGRMTKGRVSYPIIKMFLESGEKASIITSLPEGKEPANMAMLLRGYVKRHKIPIQVITRSKQVVLMRIDDPKDEDAQKIIKDLTSGDIG